MQNLRITGRKLTDGSEVFAVQFETTHSDNTQHTVTLECNSEVAAGRIKEALDEDVAYAETDAQA